MSKQQKTNPQAEAIIEVAKGLHAIADAILNKGADVPAIVETTPTGNPTDDAIIELAKGVHQIKQGVANLPTDTAPTPNDSTAERIAYRKVERITFELMTPDFFDNGGTWDIYLSRDAVFDQAKQAYRQVIRLVGDYGDAISPKEFVLEPDESYDSKPFTMHQYVPEVTIEWIAYGDAIHLETHRAMTIYDSSLEDF